MGLPLIITERVDDIRLLLAQMDRMGKIRLGLSVDTVAPLARSLATARRRATGFRRRRAATARGHLEARSRWCTTERARLSLER